MDSGLAFGAVGILIAIASVLFSVLLGAAMIFFIIKLLKGMMGNTQLLKTGIPAVATVVQVAQTNTYVNRQPQVRMVLNVQINDPSYRGAQSSYQATVTQVVNLINIPRIQPGQQLQARVDPANPAAVYVIV